MLAEGLRGVKRFSVRGALISMCCCALLLLGGGGRAGAQMMLRTSESDLKLLTFLAYLNHYYVDSISSSDLTEQAIRAMLEQLDPHSAYVPKEESEAIAGEIEGKFSGIGIEFSIQRDTLRVMAAVPNGPAERNGMRAGDRIVRVDGSDVAGVGLTNQRVFKLLRGPKGTKVSIVALRNGERLEFLLTRDEIPLHSVDASYMVDGAIGYVRINRFAINTHEEFRAAMAKLQRQGMKRVVVDLRGNGGGVMQAAVQIASDFLEKDALVVYSRGRAIPSQDFFALERGVYADMPLAVLVDEYSASASEILAGAIQDNDRGIVVGRRTFGKGLVQNQLSLPDGSLVRITMARYYTPSGRMVQTPYRLGHQKDYVEEFRRRFEHGEAFSRDSIRLADTLIKYTLRSKRPVYGGGGILPDVFVPLDTLQASAYVSQLDRKGLIHQSVLQHFDTHRAELLRKYPNFHGYSDSFSLDEALRDSIMVRGKREKVVPQGDSLTALDGELLSWRVKSYMARSLFGFNELIRVFNERSPILDSAVYLLHRWEGEGRALLGKESVRRRR